MFDHNTRRIPRQAAKRYVIEMSRPSGMTKRQWKAVKEYLLAIADFYPRACPSQIRLAVKLDCDVRSVRRYEAAAVAFGLLTVTPNEGAKPRRYRGVRTNVYHINLAHQDEDRLSSHVVPLRGTPPTATPPETSSPSAEPLAAASGRRDLRLAAVVKFREPERDVSTGPPSSRPRRTAEASTAKGIVAAIDSGRRGEKRASTPPRWKRIAIEFDRQWNELVENLRPDLANWRGLETLGHVRSYDKAHWSNKTEDEVIALITEFITAIGRYDITLKRGQSAWMKFTGAWGRGREQVETQSEQQRRYRALLDRQNAQA